jgi:hypothetical protein
MLHYLADDCGVLDTSNHLRDVEISLLFQGTCKAFAREAVPMDYQDS